MVMNQQREHQRKKRFVTLLSHFSFLIFLSTFPLQTHAATPSTLILRHKHFLFSISPAEHPEWQIKKEQWRYHGTDIEPPPELLTDGDSLPALPEGVTKVTSITWNRGAIREDLAALLSPLERDAGSVTIGRGADGKVTFDGVGLPGRHVNIDLTVTLAIQAMEAGTSEIRLPVTETQPQITVTDPTLAASGIQEVVTVGESNFNNSPANRRHNIATGLAKFNGHIIPKGTTFSFDETLGLVDGSTGYLKELVIKGARTEPDFGGGLCQVSSTAYRGVWEYGFPITQRINHSYAVSHYAPQGTDATVYPPNVDMKFTNDSPGDLLIQTYAENDLAYFIYYGTKDGRESEVVGPFTWDRIEAPTSVKMEKTTEIPAGTQKKVGERVAGMKAMWVRILTTPDGKKKIEPVYSDYEARPLYYLVGVTPDEMPIGDLTTEGESSSSSSENASSSSVGAMRRNDIPLQKPPRSY